MKNIYFILFVIVSVTAQISFSKEKLSDYIPAKDLKEYHFPIDEEFRDAWFEFYTLSYGRDAERIMVKQGQRIAPSIMRAIKDKKLYGRRYAIGVLGYLKEKTAVPVLLQILNSNDEKDYFRGDALISLFQIDREIGKKEALRILEASSDDELYHVSVAKRIINDPGSIELELAEKGNAVDS